MDLISSSRYCSITKRTSCCKDHMRITREEWRRSADLGHVQIGLHNVEGVGGISTGCIWVIEEVLDFREGRLTEIGTPKFYWDRLAGLLEACDL